VGSKYTKMRSWVYKWDRFAAKKKKAGKGMERRGKGKEEREEIGHETPPSPK